MGLHHKILNNVMFSKFQSKAGNLIAESVLIGDVVSFEKHFNSEWENWQFNVTVNANLTAENKDNQSLPNSPMDEPDFNINSFSQFTVTLSLIHFVVLTRQNQILKFLLNSPLTQGKWNGLVLVSKNGPDKKDVANLAEEDSWIYKATCIHLAAKFNTNGLHMILSKCKELVKETHTQGEISPLHVAVGKTSSLSTR